MLEIKNNEIIDIINTFIEFIENDSINLYDKDKNLMMLLDALGFAISQCKFKFDENDYKVPKRMDYTQIREMLQTKFPDFGYYNVPEDLIGDLAVTKIMVGDAMDDIVDIYIELKDVQWMWYNTSIDNALWYFENNYICHWGVHLRDLQRYIYYKLFE